MGWRARTEVLTPHALAASNAHERRTRGIRPPGEGTRTGDPCRMARRGEAGLGDPCEEDRARPRSAAWHRPS